MFRGLGDALDMVILVEQGRQTRENDVRGQVMREAVRGTGVRLCDREAARGSWISTLQCTDTSQYSKCTPGLDLALSLQLTTKHT